MRRIRQVFGIDVDWLRPLDRSNALRVDVAFALLLACLAVLSLDTARSLGALSTDHLPDIAQYGLVVSIGLGFAVRRVFPVAAMIYALVHYMVLGLFAPEMSPVFVLQIYYFLSLFSVIAWAANRVAALALTCVMLVAGAVWIFADVALGDGWDLLEQLPDLGPLPPELAAILQVSVSTLTFLLAAIAGGLVAWWSARREETARAQAITIAGQVDLLNEQSLTEERLRIARELHDVVGHHVAVMGIQAAAAQRLRDRDPDLSLDALQKAQESSRDATHDLRLLLTALRAPMSAGPQSMVPGGGLTGLAAVVDTFENLGLSIELTMLGPVESVPLNIADCAQRVTQEALTNVTRHSTADRADVSVTIAEHGDGEGTLRMAIRDAGESVPGSTGSGMGLTGMQERVSLCGGSLQHRSRTDGPGFEVRAAFAWADEEV